MNRIRKEELKRKMGFVPWRIYGFLYTIFMYVAGTFLGIVESGE